VKKPFNEQDILNLLTSLKTAENNYPSDMIKSRRDMFMKQAAAMVVLAGAGGNGASASGNAQGAVSGTTTGTAGSLTISSLLETALVVALVVEAGVATYIYRDKISDFIKSTLSPKVEQTTNPPDDSSLEVPAVIEETATATMEETATVTVTSVETPAPPNLSTPAGSVGGSNNDANSNGVENVQATATPDPKDNPGLHLGQTKQPTQDPNLDYPNSNSNKKKDNNNSNKKDKNK